jgi:hypothetical protein
MEALELFLATFYLLQMRYVQDTGFCYDMDFAGAASWSLSAGHCRPASPEWPSLR